MKLNYYRSFFSPKLKTWCPGVKAQEFDCQDFKVKCTQEDTRKYIEAFRGGDKEAKRRITAVCWTGFVPSGEHRMKSSMKPTQLFMVDVDHVENPSAAWDAIRQRFDRNTTVRLIEKVVCAHITPSGQGLRIVMRCVMDYPTLEEHMRWLNDILHLDEFGDFDASVKDLSRLSFMPLPEEILLFNPAAADEEGIAPILPTDDAPAPATRKGTRKQTAVTASTEEPSGEYKPCRSTYADERYHGHLVTDIIDKYVETYGLPEDGERHNFYNKMVMDFRNICSNNPLILHDLLPRFGGDNEVEWARTLSQCRSICRTNNNTSIPRQFLSFLVKQGFYKKVNPAQREPLAEGASAGERSKKAVSAMPTPPPVMRELLSIVPDDFIIPTINALMPILGTLTSYVRAEDPTNNKRISTSFFSIVFAPPSSGKSFMEMYVNLLLRDLMLRDTLNDARDALYARLQQTKSANEKGQPLPETSVRIMEAKNSEAEFLEKQRNNHGHHMFTYCAEIDQWRKGIRAAGGNKDDMVRIAWDNGIYGQNFKSANTFKGKVELYWNVLMAGTEDQLTNYFKNVTNGLVTRCCFTKIHNQEFREQPPEWKKLSKKAQAVVDEFVSRCDAQTYTSPINFDASKVWQVADEDFDKEVPWKMTFRPLQTIDIAWILPTVKRFHHEQNNLAIRDNDFARDIFRRRVADRGKRLALMCTQFYGGKMKAADKRECCKWIYWWMKQDIDNILAIFGEKFVKALKEGEIETRQAPTLFSRLEKQFTTKDVDSLKQIFGYTNDTRKIISRWKGAGLIKKISKDKFEKTK